MALVPTSPAIFLLLFPPSIIIYSLPQARTSRLHGLYLRLRPNHPPKPLGKLAPIKVRALRRFHGSERVPAVAANGAIGAGARGLAGRLPAQGTVLLSIGAVIGKGAWERGFRGGGMCGWGVVKGFGDAPLADEADQRGALRCLEDLRRVHGCWCRAITGGWLGGGKMERRRKRWNGGAAACWIRVD